MRLTSKNYFSREADERYMSVSQYKNFKQCEAMAIAKLTGQYEIKSDAFLVGNYVHAWNEGTLAQFKEEHPEIISSRGATKGQLKAPFQIADKMIATLQNDTFINRFLQGQKEIIMTGELFGMEWKIMIDVYNPQEGRFCDLKTVKGIHDTYWLEGERVSFIEKYGYITQMAVYQAIEEQNRLGVPLEPYIIAVSKDEVPDKAVIHFDADSLEAELNDVQSRMERIKKVKEGQEMPRACGKCDYCRKTKKLDRAIHYSELIGGK